MKKKSLLLILLIGIVFNSNSQIITGSVESDIGQLMADVKIVDANGKQIALTNGNGNTAC